ncbi:hypothetical protein SASPL_106138 [Salvia splendens]|uniref:Uncharacterized protein n=1 Tax=Salvia splendens TaxID=180675 RepID=A0A8X9ABF4_SALSN|nr:hypothetical protein SASPL_106138 [Salvia splendens]
MSDFQAGVGRTNLMCSMPSIAELPAVTDPVLSPAVESPSIASRTDPIRVLFEQLMVGLARLETRMDDYVRHQFSRHTLRPDPKPPHSRAQSRPLEVPLPFTQPFAAVSVTTPPPPASATFLGRPEGFRPNPSCAPGPFRAGFTTQQSSWDLPPTLSERNSHWESPPSTRSQHLQPWGLPPSSTNQAAWDPWVNRFPDHQIHNGQASWDQLGQRQPAPPPIADAMSDSLILDTQFEYSCDDPKDFDCVSNRGMVEGEHCDIPKSGLVSTDSILATEATKFIDREATYSHKGNVSNQAIVVTSNISGEEGKLFDDEPPQTSPILQLYTLDVNEINGPDLLPIDCKILYDWCRDRTSYANALLKSF